MCSNRCANPVRSFGSMRKPMRVVDPDDRGRRRGVAGEHHLQAVIELVVLDRHRHLRRRPRVWLRDDGGGSEAPTRRADAPTADTHGGILCKVQGVKVQDSGHQVQVQASVERDLAYALHRGSATRAPCTLQPWNRLRHCHLAACRRGAEIAGRPSPPEQRREHRDRRRSRRCAPCRRRPAGLVRSTAIDPTPLTNWVTIQRPSMKIAGTAITPPQVST